MKGAQIMIIKDMPESERPREKMLKLGPESLSNAELIASIIGSGNNGRSAMEIAQDILAEGQGLRFLGGCTMEEILSIDGIGSARGCQLMASVELGKRLAYSRLEDMKYYDSPEAIAEFFTATMRYLSREHFRVMLLDSQGGVISVEEIGIGGLMEVEVNPGDVFSVALRKNAAGIVAAHNHPSGDCSPSLEDELLTERLVQAGELMGIPILDHLIIGAGRYESIKYRNKNIGGIK